MGIQSSGRAEQKGQKGETYYVSVVSKHDRRDFRRGRLRPVARGGALLLPEEQFRAWHLLATIRPRWDVSND